MKNSKKTIAYLIGAFLMLLTVSVYRQVSMRYAPNSLIRPYVVYVVYLSLLVGWGYSIRERVIHRSMRIFLYCQAIVMVLWITVRLVQDTWLYQNLYFMRISGYLINIPAVLIPLFSFYTSIGLGQVEEYRIPKKWYLLLIPALSLILLALTDEWHHFLYYIIPEEPQPNLYFHPNYGLYLVYVWVLFCMFLRVFVIYWKHRGGTEGTALIRKVALIEPVLLLGFSVPYLMASFSVQREIVEYSVGLFYVIVLAWELYVLLGLVPVNTQYPSVFEYSTIALQILDEKGQCLIQSKYNYHVDQEMFRKLLEEKAVLLPNGKELNLVPIKGGYTVWTKDVSQMMEVVEQLSANVENLEKENLLKKQELKIRSEEVALEEKNKLYDQMSHEVGRQIQLIERKLEERPKREDTQRLFREICYIGIFIKRRSNFRIMEQEEGCARKEDMELVLRDLVKGLQDLQISCEVVWNQAVVPTGQCFLRSIDVLEEELEKSNFHLDKVKISYLSNQEFGLEFQIAGEKGSVRYGSEA